MPGRSVLAAGLAFAALLIGVGPAAASSLLLTANEAAAYEHGRQVAIPAAFGSGEFTLELWIRPTPGPVGPTTDASVAQRTHWSTADRAPYSAPDWWYEGNFLLDGHNNATFVDGTFSLQMYGGGRLRWLLGDGANPGPGGVWSVGAHPAGGTPSLLDGGWHQVTLVRRFAVSPGARLELWIDGALVDTETTATRTDLRIWRNASRGFPAGQSGWFWGAEKQAAIGVLAQYEDYKGLLDEAPLLGPREAAAGDQLGLRRSGQR